jgi:general secretion pathway protein B
MSYILEALRKADAERERGAVPDLHAQLLPLTAGSSSADAGGRPVVLWGGVALAVAALGVALWWFVGARPDVAPALAAASAPALTLPASAAALPPAAPAASAPAPPTVAVAAAPTAAPAPRKPAPPAAKPAKPAKAPVRASDEDTPLVAPPVVAKASKPPPAALQAERVPPLAELPEDLRRLVPAMAMGGSVYSPDAKRRMVIVNGQVFVEGSKLTPELSLETVNPKSAVFSVRGQRFSMPL